MFKTDLYIQNLFFPSVDHFTVVCLVVWPLNENEGVNDLVLIEASLLCLCHLLLITSESIINIRKAGRFLSKEGQFQPHLHSKDRQLSKQL